MDIKDVWEKILEKYSIIKEVYIECEETDPQLKSNLQPLNEFRAALDHIMKMMLVYFNEDEKEVLVQYDKLNSHLTRSFYDICDMLSINYRNKIIDILDGYDVQVINTVIPEYYSQFKPTIEEISLRIVRYRTQKGTANSDNYERFNEYKDDVLKLKNIFLKISQSQSNLIEVKEKIESKEKKSNRKNLWLGALLGAIGSAMVAVVLHLFGI